MAKATIGLDHVGVVARALDPLADTFRKLGFTIAPRCALMSTDGGGPKPLDQINDHIVLGEGYVELTAMTKPSPAHHLAPFLARYEGLHIAAFGCENADETHAELTARGIPLTPVMGAAREVDYPGAKGIALFRWFKVGDEAAPEGLYCFVQHLTRELVMRPELASHANGALTLRGITVCPVDVGTAVARHERLFDRIARRLGLTHRVELEPGFVDIVAAEDLRGLFPGALPPAQPSLAALTFDVDDPAATAEALEAAGIKPRVTGQTVWVRAADAGGVIVAFEPRD